MRKYKPSDDGKAIDGKVVVFVPSGGAGPGERQGGARIAAAGARNADAAAQAAALTAAAAAAVPFCEECTKERQQQHSPQAR